MNTQQKAKGFTIIEVVLVLAIAGLIFLMVFTALPALQRSQRDTARKSDVSTVASTVTTYMSNNRGAFPGTGSITLPVASGTTGFGSYLGSLSSNTTSVTVATAGTLTLSPVDSDITVTQKTTCGDSSSASQTLLVGTTRQFTVVTKLESGNGAYFCQDS